MDARVDPDEQNTGRPVYARRRGGRVLSILIVIVLLGGAAYLGRDFVIAHPPAPEPAMAPPKVTVSAPLQRKIATYSTFTGQFASVERVEIRAQVSGYLTEIHFKDGQLVKKGDLLFVIDPRPYEIALANAKAQVETAQASLELSRKQLERTTSLMRSDFASHETMDQRTQQQHAAEAAFDQAKAMVRSAELNMTWTYITAPISGRISQRRITIGNLITGGQAGGGQASLLTTIVSLDPVYLDFDMGESDYLAYQRFLHRPRDGQPVDRTVSIALSDETGWKHKGRLDFLDNEMDRSSGTIRARATVPNSDLLIAAGQFARLRIPTADANDRLLIPDAALLTDQSKTMVMLVGDDGKVVPKLIQIGAQVGNLRIVKSGLGRDDKVIINGLMFARPGVKVTPEQGTIPDVPDEG